MSTRLVALRNRVVEIEKLADELLELAEKLSNGENVQPALSVAGQKWYRGARALLVQNNFSEMDEFDDCYIHYAEMGGKKQYTTMGIEYYIKLMPGHHNVNAGENFRHFQAHLLKARSLVLALEQELLSRELPIVTELSLELAASEFERAQQVLDQSQGDEVLMRVAGVIARIALERHLFTVADNRRITIVVNPPTKKKAELEDVIQTLVKNGVVTAVQRSHLTTLVTIANNCAHPKEKVNYADVERLVKGAREEAAVIV